MSDFILKCVDVAWNARFAVVLLTDKHTGRTDYRTSSYSVGRSNRTLYRKTVTVFQKSNLDQVSMWLPYLKELKPVVQILVCEECTDDDGSAAALPCLCLILQMFFYLTLVSFIMWWTVTWSL